MTPINGTPAPANDAPAPPDPRHLVAEAVYTAMMDEGDPPFSDLDAEDAADMLVVTENYLTAHLNFLTANGFRIVPAGAVPRPQSEPEAMAMLQAAKGWFDAAKRKGKLLAGATAKPKLILPPGVH